MTDDWQRFLFRTTIQGGGFILLQLDNMNTTGVPRVLQGSRFEISGSFFLTENDEDIGGSLVENQVNFIYAVPLGNSAHFVYSTDRPVFDPRRGGWMNGTDRAVARVFPTDENTFWDKVVLDSESSIRSHNQNIVPATGGTPVATGVVGRLITTMLPAGAYYVELQGGSGGRGGDGGSSAASSNSLSSDRSGGAGGRGFENIFITPEFSKVMGNTPDGENAINGINGSHSIGGTGGGGGGGKAGRLSYCHIERIGLLIARGGRGGNGGMGGGILAHNWAAHSGRPGEAPPQGDRIVSGFILHTATVVTLFLGNNGGDGARGGNGANRSSGTVQGGTGGDGATEFAEASSGYARIFRAPL